MAGQQLSALLLRSGLLTREQVEEAEREHRRGGVRLSQVVVDLGFAAEGLLYDALARVAGLARLDLTRERLDRACLRYVDSIWALDHGMVPIRADEGQGLLRVAVTDPTNQAPLDDLSRRTGLRVEPVLGSEAEIGRLIRHQFFEESLDTSAPESVELGPPAETPPAIEHGMVSALSELSRLSEAPGTGEQRAIEWMQAMVEHHQ